MDLLEALVIGSYLYITGFGSWLYKRIEAVKSNHMKHMQADIDEIKKHIGMKEESKNDAST